MKLTNWMPTTSLQDRCICSWLMLKIQCNEFFANTCLWWPFDCKAHPCCRHMWVTDGVKRGPRTIFVLARSTLFPTRQWASPSHQVENHTSATQVPAKQNESWVAKTFKRLTTMYHTCYYNERLWRKGNTILITSDKSEHKQQVLSMASKTPILGQKKHESLLKTT